MLQEWPQKSRSSGPRAHLSCCPARPPSKDRGGEAGARPEPTWPDLQPARPAQLKGLSATTRGPVTPSSPGCRPLLCVDMKARPEQPLWAGRQQARVTQRASEDGAPASRLQSPWRACALCVLCTRGQAPPRLGATTKQGCRQGWSEPLLTCTQKAKGHKPQVLFGRFTVNSTSSLSITKPKPEFFLTSLPQTSHLIRKSS